LKNAPAKEGVGEEVHRTYVLKGRHSCPQSTGDEPTPLKCRKGGSNSSVDLGKNREANL